MRPRLLIVLGLMLGAAGVSTAVRAGSGDNKPSQSLADTAATILDSSFSAESAEKAASPFIPPGHGGTPPGQGGTPPGQTTPPGQGGTPPGQADKDDDGNNGNGNGNGNGNNGGNGGNGKDKKKK